MENEVEDVGVEAGTTAFDPNDPNNGDEPELGLIKELTDLLSSHSDRIAGIEKTLRKIRAANLDQEVAKVNPETTLIDAIRSW